MVSPSLRAELDRALDALPPERQREVVDFARALLSESTTPKGVSGEAFVKSWAGALSPEIVDEMEQAIEEGCERIDPESW